MIDSIVKPKFSEYVKVQQFVYYHYIMGEEVSNSYLKGSYWDTFTDFKANIFDVGEDILDKYESYNKQQFPAYFMSNEENLLW